AKLCLVYEVHNVCAAHKQAKRMLRRQSRCFAFDFFFYTDSSFPSIAGSHWLDCRGEAGIFSYEAAPS
ncbi:MAG: hypothetical protein ACW7DO_14160, partial [Paraglaciecola chathamensis]